MTKFNETEAGQSFIASGASRETSPAVMEAIAFFARDAKEAEAIWSGYGIGKACSLMDIWEHATSNGAREVDLEWGFGGEAWLNDR